MPAAARANVEAPPPAPQHVIYLDAGGLAAQNTWRYRVAKGDTLGGIAQKQLGTTRRTAEIQRLNPAVDPRALRVGQVLLLPPKGVTKARPWLDVLVALPGGPAQALQVDAPVTLPLGPVRVFAVPHAHLSRLRRGSGTAAAAAAALFADPQVACSELIGVPVPAGQSPGRAVTHLALEGLEGRALRVAVREQRLYGGTAAPLASAAPAPASGGLLTPLLLLAAGLVVVGLVLLAARRLPHAPAEPPADAP